MPDEAESELQRALRAAAPEAFGELWLAAVRAAGPGADAARLHAAVVAAVRERLDPVASERVVAALGPPPPPRPLPPPPKRQWRRFALAWGLGLAATAIVALAPRWLRPPLPADRDALYFVMVDRFADGQPDPEGTVDRSDPQGWHGGDLAGILARIDHLDRLGVGALWLSPVSRSRSEPHGEWGAYHGYWVTELGAVEPRFGTVEELRALSDALHARGMKLYLDVVYNHVAPDAPLQTEHPDWFHHNGDVIDWEDPVQAVTHDVHGLPDLAQENEEVYTALRDASLWWIEQVRPDGFRVDAVRHLPEGFLARLGDELRAAAGPGFELVGEIYDGNLDRLAARAAADRLDAVFDFPMYFAIRDSVCDGAPLAKVAALAGADYGGARPVTLVDNHDLPRIRSACGGDLDRVALALALQITARGTPSITWGTEVGLAGAEEPANRADMVFDGGEAPIGATLRELLALRRRWPALRSDRTRVIGLSPDAVLLARTGEAETVTIAVRSGTEGALPRWEALGDRVDEVRVVSGAGSLTDDGQGPYVARFERAPVRPQVRAGAADLVLWLADRPELAEGDRVVLTGPGALLGAWDPEEGVRLDVDGAFRLRVRDGEVLAFKPVVLHADGSATWEPHADRFLLVTSDRWSGLPGPCGRWCAPVEEGAAQATIHWGEPALLEAARARDLDGLRRALAADGPGEGGPEAIRLAMEQGDEAMVSLLLDAGLGEPELVHQAVRLGSAALLARLVEADLPIDLPDASGITPLIAAVDASDEALVRLLLDAGADPGQPDAAGRTARDHAAASSLVIGNMLQSP